MKFWRSPARWRAWTRATIGELHQQLSSCSCHDTAAVVAKVTVLIVVNIYKYIVFPNLVLVTYRVSLLMFS